MLLRPQSCHTAPNVEDRLFVPEEYPTPFREKGWKLEARGAAEVAAA